MNCQDKLDELTDEIEKLKKTLQEIEDTSTSGNDGAVYEMENSDVPTRKYEFLLGRSVAFTEILRVLGVRPAKRQASLGTQLFKGFKAFKRILS